MPSAPISFRSCVIAVRGRSGFFAGAGIPGEDGKKDFHIVAMKIVDKFLESGEAAGEIAEEIELIAVVDAEVGIDVPEEDGVDGAEAALGFGEEFFGRVLAGFRVVDGAVPNEELDLGERFAGSRLDRDRCSRNRSRRSCVRRSLRQACIPASQDGKSEGSAGPAKEDFGGRGRDGEGHGAVGSDEGVAGFPFVGAERDGTGEDED